MCLCARPCLPQEHPLTVGPVSTVPMATTWLVPFFVSWAALAGKDCVSCSQIIEGASCIHVLLNRTLHSVRSGTTTPPLAPTSTMDISVCPRCGTNKKSGKHSCCARDGAWFKNCGDGGDTKFDHTWAEGIQACDRKLLKDCVV